MTISRREFIGAAGVAAAGMMIPPSASAAEPQGKFQLSACDWSLNAHGPGGMAIARRVGLQGLEVSANHGEVGGKLSLADPAVRAKYKAEVKKTGVVVSSTAMGLLNSYPLASDPRGPAWLEQTIEATQDLGAGVMLMAFFGKGDLLDGTTLKKKEADTVVGRLKNAAPKAKECGVILGIESWLSCEQHLHILDRVKHDSVRVYYDIGNMTHRGYDVPAEIRTLGGRICQIHMKDYGGWLGTKVKLGPIAEAVNAIGYKGWLVLETNCPTGKRDADFRKNAETIRKMMGINV